MVSDEKGSNTQALGLSTLEQWKGEISSLGKHLRHLPSNIKSAANKRNSLWCARVCSQLGLLEVVTLGLGSQSTKVQVQRSVLGWELA